jgi:prophage maintenance system killer protein
MRYLDLARIEQSLREVQRHFQAINAQLDVKREDMTDDLIANLLCAYRYLDDLVDRFDGLFADRELEELLELNHRVLCGDEQMVRTEYHRHVLATQEKFYHNLHWVRDWYQKHRNDPVYKRAAGVYVRILCQPQLFIEGNHRTGALIASLELVRHGRPPFVLSQENAVAYFNPSSVIKWKNRLKYMDRTFHIPGLKKKFGQFLEKQAAYDYLLPRGRPMTVPSH